MLVFLFTIWIGVASAEDADEDDAEFAEDEFAIYIANSSLYKHHK